MKQQERIDTFDGEHDFLSNFYACPVTYKGLTYLSSEAAFQAQKTRDVYKQVHFTRMAASKSKRAGRKLPLRPDWDEVKYQVMHEIVLQKFTQNPVLGAKLVKTGDAELIEGNWWNDTYWGVCNGEGQNNLGKILMDVRSYLSELNSAMRTLTDLVAP